MKFKAAHFLFAGTAVFALGAFSTQGQAQEALTVTNGNQIYASSGLFDESDAPNVDTAAANDTIAISNGATLTIANNGTASDGTNVNTFSPGAITGTGTGAVVITANNGTNTLVVTVDSINTATGNVTINNSGSNTASTAVSLTTDSTIGGNLSLANTDTTTLKTVSLATNGSLTVGGTTSISGGGFAGAGSALDAFGNATFNGAVTLADNTGGSVLGFTGTTAQTVGGTGAINGAGVNQGTLVISNAAGVTIGNTIGNLDALKTISIASDTGDSAATFTGNVTAQSIVLGDATGTASNSLTINSTNAAITVSGPITGALSGETNNIALNGANTITVDNGVGLDSHIDNISIGANTKVTADAGLEATSSLDIGSNGILTALSNITAPITLEQGATLDMTGAGATIDGDVNGAGTLNVSGTLTAEGSIGGTSALTAINVANGASLTVTTAAGAVNTAGNRTLAATDTGLTGSGTLALTPGASTIAVTGPIEAAGAGQGAITIADGNGTVNFTGNIGASAAPVGALTIANGAGANIVNVHGNLDVAATTLNTGDTLNLLGTSNVVSGSINGGAAGRGTVTVGDGTDAAEYAFEGAIGTTRLAAFNVENAATANIGNNVTADNLNLEGTENIGGAANVALTSNTQTSIDGIFATALTGGNAVTLASNGNIVDIGINADTTIAAGNQIKISSSALTIGANGIDNRLLIEQNPSFDPSTTPVIDATVSGNTVVTVAGGSVLYVGLAGAEIPGSGSAITVIEGDTNATTSYATLLANGTIVLDNTALVALEDNGSDAQNLKVKVLYNDPNTVIGHPFATTATTLIDDTTTIGSLSQARTNLLLAPTAQQARAVASSLSPTVDGSNVTAAQSVSTQVFGVTQMRLAALEGQGAGMSSGDLPEDSHGWGQVFGQNGTQGFRDGVDGYAAKTYGAAIGYDAGVADDRAHVGVALSYARTDATSRNANNTNTDINSYQATLYGDMDIIDSMYLKGMAGYAFNDNHTDRHDVGGITDLDAMGDFNANQFAARAEVGRPVAIGTYIGNVVLTPSLSADYTYYNAGSYTESGAGTANLNVSQDSLNRLDLGAQLAADYLIHDQWYGYWKPGVSIGYRYDVIGDNISTSSSFTGGGAAFNTDGLTPARGELDLGTSLKYYTNGNWNLSAEYDYQYRQDYHANDALLRATYKFN